MKRVVKTTMEWDFSGTETVVSVRGAHEHEWHQTYLKQVAIILLGQTGTVRIEFFNQNGLHDAHKYLEKCIREITNNCPAHFTDRAVPKVYPNMHVSYLLFEKARGRKFTHSAVDRFLLILRELKASNRKGGWPIPQVTLETFTNVDGYLISEGDWLATQFYPHQIIER